MERCLTDVIFDSLYAKVVTLNWLLVPQSSVELIGWATQVLQSDRVTDQVWSAGFIPLPPDFVRLSSRADPR